MARSLQNTSLRSEDLQQMIQIKLEDAMYFGCLQTLVWFIRGNAAIKSSEMIQWVIEVLQLTAIQSKDSLMNRECVQLAWLEVFYCFCEEIKDQSLDTVQQDLLRLSTWIDLIWDISKETEIKQACFKAYSNLYAVCPSLSTTIINVIRFALQSPAEPLRGSFITHSSFCSFCNERACHTLLSYRHGDHRIAAI